VTHTNCTLRGGPADGESVRIPDGESRYVVAVRFWAGDWFGQPTYDVRRFTYRRRPDRFDCFQFVGPNPLAHAEQMR
jgi:hypothetical protein